MRIGARPIFSIIFSLNTSAGVFHPRHFRGDALRRSLIIFKSFSVSAVMSRLRGSHLRARRFVFSTVPFVEDSTGDAIRLDGQQAPVTQSKHGPDWEKLEALFRDIPTAHDLELELAYGIAVGRAAIMQYSGGLSREETEAYAFRHTPRPNRG